MTPRELFLQDLQEALDHLYDPDRLRRSELAELLGVADRYDTPACLQAILTEAIEALRPTTGTPAQSRAWRIFDLLSLCYVQQLSQRVAAGQLGISPRHLRRERLVALEALAYQLGERFQLTLEADQAAGEARPSSSAASEGSAQPGPGIGKELGWVRDAPAGTFTDLNVTLPEVLDMAHGLAAQRGAILTVSVDSHLPRVGAHPVALGQALLNVIGVALHRAASGQVQIAARSRHWEVEMLVTTIGPGQPTGRQLPSTPVAPSPDDEASLEQAAQLAKLCGGTFTLAEQAGGFSAALRFPALERFPVLVIDDSADTLQLLQRYASGTRYAMIPTQNPEEAFKLAARRPPRLIVLDVMMPQADGWRVLGRLRQHPLTAGIPVIVCTILAQEELAFYLGASGFIRKPVARQAFLEALDRQVALLSAPESASEPERKPADR